MKKEMKRLLAILLTAVLISGHVFTALASSGELDIDNTAVQETDAEAENVEEPTTEEPTEKNSEASKESEETSEATTEEVKKSTEATTEEAKKSTEATTDATTEEKTETGEATTEQTAGQKDDTSTATTEQKEKTEETTTVQSEKTTAVTEQSGETVQTTTEKPEETTTAQTSDEEETSSVEEAKTVEEETKLVMSYEDDEVEINVAEVDKGAIPENASLKVVPILENDEETETQFKEVKEKLHKNAEDKEYEIAGFLAYDITFVDKDGKEVEPNGAVKVSMEYKKAVMPEAVDTNEIPVENLGVTVMHLEENENGDVKDVVDMVAEDDVEAEVTTTEKAEVEKAEFVTDSFSMFTITWTSLYDEKYDKELEAVVVDTTGKTIAGLENKSVSVSSGTEFVFFEKCEDLSISDKTYEFKKAVIASSADNISLGTEIYSMSGSYMGGYKYKTSANSEEKTFDNNSNKVYLIYEEQGTASGGGSGSGSSQGAELAHQKYIKDNGDGSYDLTLNVVGAAGTETDPAEIDVIFVVDTSGSMKREMNSDSDTNSPNRRIDKLNSAVKDAIGAIEARADVEAKYALVTFESSATTKYSWMSNAATIKNGLPTSVDGGTNYEDALLEVETLLNSSTVANDGARKIVVFLTDGDCTQYNGVDKPAGNGNTYDSTAMLKAQTVLARLTTMNAFYTVGVGPASSYTHLSELNTEVPSGVTTKNYNGTSIDNLKTAFDEIVGSVTKISASNVTIVDTLTPHVDIKTGTELTVKVTDADGNDVTETEVTAGGIVASYDAATKQIKLDFADTYEVKNGYTYSVTAKITPNEAANQLYIENNYSYPHTGEENTDAPGNTTSSGKKGIFSNVEDSAKLTYTTNGVDKEADYNRPVVQIVTTPTVPPTTEKELTREKYIKYYEDSDSYDLTLNVAGQVGSVNNKAKLDVVLIMDRSGSMAGNNITNAKKAVSTLMTTLTNKQTTIDARCKVVMFNKIATNLTEWVTPEQANTSVQSLSNMTGGTNYQAGFVAAENALSKTRSGAEKIVIFLTDGEPTYYNDGGTGSYTTNAILNATYAEAKNINCSQFYAVGIGLGNVDVYGGNRTTGLAILNQICTNVNASKKQAYNTDENTDLTTIFSTIAGSITKFFCTNVTIRDNLSEFVEVNGKNAKLEIKVTQTVTDEDGKTSEVVVGTSSGGTISTGATLNLVATSTNGAATLTASYNPELKQVVLDFPDEYELEADYKYYVTVNIIASAKAYSDYAANNGSYNKDESGNEIVGDEGTDAIDNQTSAGKLGFRSNNTATVTYTYNGTQNVANYDHPVVQVFVKDHSVEKIWEGSSLSSITANLNAKVTIDGEEKIITKSDFSALPDVNQILTDENNWKYTWSYLPKYYHEDGKVSEITYTVTEEETSTIKEDYTVSYDTTAADKTVITNTFNKEWQIIKISSNSDALKLGGAIFELSSKEDSDVKYTATSNTNGILEWKDASGQDIDVKNIPAGTYTFTEKIAPAGYAVSTDEWTIVLERAGAIPSITLGDEEVDASISENGKMYTFSFENEALYALPSSGSGGIYWYLISGMLMMMAAALIIYKNKCREVQRG